jgi:DNA polymerase-2
MKGFIVQYDWEDTEDSCLLKLFGRLENSGSFVAVLPFEPYLYINEADLERSSDTIRNYKAKTEKTEFINFKGKRVSRVLVKNQANLIKISKELHEQEITTYEADLKPYLRYIIDKDLFGNIDIEGEYDIQERIDRVYKNPEITPAKNTYIKLKILSIDIEIGGNGELWCISLYSESLKKTFICSQEEIKGAIKCNSEEDCLEKFKKAVIEFDPDIITGWNVIDFDFNILKKKFEHYKIPFDLGRTNEKTRIRIEENFFRSSSMDVSGRLVLDGLNFIKDPLIQEAPTIKKAEFNSYTLEDVSQKLLGKGKLIKGKNRAIELEELYANNKEKLVQYNLLDAQLVYEILEKTKLIELAIEKSQLTGLPLDKNSGSIINLDSLYIREAKKRKVVCPTSRFRNKEERIKGGFVMTPKPGLYQNVIVLDFKSLYPSIIKTFNIDPSSMLEKQEKNCIISPNKSYFKNQEGILPIILERLHKARENAKKEKRELSSYAIKIIMNSFFGVIASPNCRYFNLDMANAITSFGQEIIKLTAEKIKNMGLEVIYMDTDSAFIETKMNKEKSKKLGQEISKNIDEFYKKYIQEKYQRESFLDLEFDKLYTSLLMPKLRIHEKKKSQEIKEETIEKGAKKRYAGLIEDEGKEELDIVGLEAIRGDWTEAAKEFQIELLKRVFKNQEFKKFIKEYIQDLKKGKLDKKLIYKKSIRKELDEYTKTTPPHVKAARQLDIIEDNRIEYYITTAGPEPIQKIKHKIDYEHYIEKQIKPIAKTVLETLSLDFESLIQSSKQETLF